MAVIKESVTVAARKDKDTVNTSDMLAGAFQLKHVDVPSPSFLAPILSDAELLLH